MPNAAIRVRISEERFVPLPVNAARSKNCPTLAHASASGSPCVALVVRHTYEARHQRVSSARFTRPEWRRQPGTQMISASA